METIVLLGSEDVRSAGNTISSAAGEMRQAALNLDGTADRFLNRLEELVLRFEDAAEKIAGRT